MTNTIYVSIYIWKILEIAFVAYEENETSKAEKFVPLNKDIIPFYLRKLDDLVKSNNGYFALGRVWFFSILFYYLITMIIW